MKMVKIVHFFLQALTYLSKSPATMMSMKSRTPRRGRNNRSFFQKKSDALSKESVLSVFELECNCDEMCCYLLASQLDNPLEFILNMRRDRFTGMSRAFQGTFFFILLDL